MLSREEFDDKLAYENTALSRDNLYQAYLYLSGIEGIDQNFEMKKDIVWKKENARYKSRNYDKIKEEYYITLGIKESYHNHLFHCDDKYNFWKLMGFFDKIDFRTMRDRYLPGKNTDVLQRYTTIILNHMIPINNKYTKDYVEKMTPKQVYRNIVIKKKKSEKKEGGGVYGIYENGALVYIGMTMRPFEARWKEHQENIEKGSNELALYGLIDANAKIEFKKLLEVDKMDSNDKITKRDLQAMEFALIQEHRPKYNFAGRTQPYQF